MASKTTKLWLNFLVYLPVFLILSMISIIYFSYIFTYIAVLINAENQIPANFLLINTSNYYNAKVKGIILLAITMIFVILLLFSIMKTVITDPGYFQEPSFLECKIAATNSENNPNFKLIGNSNSNSKDSKKSEKEKIENISYLENDIINDTINKKYTFLSNSEVSELENVEKSKNNINDNNDSSNKQSLFVRDNSNDYKKSKLSINNFSNLVMETPINNTEYVGVKKDIDIYYNTRKDEINYEEKFQKKNNEEIIETNKKSIMDYKEKCIHSKKLFFFDLSNLYKKTDITKMNQCGTCQRIKIERSHHCKMCQRCVLKMDHHCPWLANCIGFCNYKYFCLTHFYGTISTGLIFFTYWETVVNVHLNFNSTLPECFFVTFVFLMNISLMVFLMWLLYVNVNLVYNGETIIEQSDRERFPSTKSFNIYDMGWKRNFTNVFGDRWYKWFLPGFANLKGDGMIYETKKNFYFEKEDLMKIALE